MITLHRVICLCIVLLFLFGCNKDSLIKESSFLNVRFDYDIYPINIKELNSTWSLHDQTADMIANGYRFERFRLHLNAVKDTGYFASPTINNIFFTDGLDFDPDSVNSGFIHISQLDSNKIRGDFRISLHDDFNGSENKIIIGKFRINNN
jgi:hypothetical protein